MCRHTNNQISCGLSFNVLISCVCRFSNHASFQEILIELNDYAGQRELVAENMMTGICSELAKYLQDLKQERKGVREWGERGRASARMNTVAPWVISVRFSPQHLSDAKKAQQNLESSFKQLESVSHALRNLFMLGLWNGIVKVYTCTCFTSSAVIGTSQSNWLFIVNTVFIKVCVWLFIVWQTKKRFAKEWAEAEKATQHAEKIEHDVNATKMDVEKVKNTRFRLCVGANEAHPSTVSFTLPPFIRTGSLWRPSTMPTTARTRRRKAGTITQPSCRSTTRSKPFSTTQRHRRSSMWDVYTR